VSLRDNATRYNGKSILFVICSVVARIARYTQTDEKDVQKTSVFHRFIPYAVHMFWTGWNSWTNFEHFVRLGATYKITIERKHKKYKAANMQSVILRIEINQMDTSCLGRFYSRKSPKHTIKYTCQHHDKSIYNITNNRLWLYYALYSSLYEMNVVWTYITRNARTFYFRRTVETRRRMLFMLRRKYDEINENCIDRFPVKFTVWKRFCDLRNSLF